MSTLKPYLQLKDRISQAWLNKYTILLILIAIKLSLFQQSLKHSLETSQNYTLDSCPTIDSYVSNLASFPHYIAKASNFMILKTIEEINEKTLEALDLIVTGAENTIIFALEMIVGTYACVLVSTIDGAVDVAVNSTESIISWVNDTLGEITDDIEDGLTDLSKFINKVVDAADTVKDLLDGDNDDDDGNSTFSHVNLTVSSLRNFHIPSSINSKLDELRDRTPDFEEVKNKTEELIRTPFEMVRGKLLNATFVDSDDTDFLYVPALDQVTICSDNSDKIDKFYDELSKDISFSVKIFVILLVLGAILALIPVIYEEYRAWRKLIILQDELNSLNEQMNPKDPIEMIEKTYNKYPTAIGIFAASKTSSNPETQTSVRWITQYMLSSRAVILLAIAISGILAVVLQFIILGILTKSLSQSKSPFNEITDEITSKIDDSITNWTVSTNNYLQNKQDAINDDVFSWVKIATDSVNDTISSFVTDMNQAISDAFNGTILYSPVKTIVSCVIENKLIKIEKGLTWIHDHAEITLPRVDEDYITQAWANDTQSDNDTDSGGIMSKASEIMSRTEDLMTTMLKSVIRQYKKGLKLELYISLALLSIWGFQLIVGLLILYFSRLLHDWNDKNEKLSISYPRNLTEEEQQMYGYPLTGNLKVMNMPASNPFGDQNRLQDPFTEKQNDLNDDNSKLTNNLRAVNIRRNITLTDTFDEFKDEPISEASTRNDYDSYDEKNDLGYNKSSWS